MHDLLIEKQSLNGKPLSQKLACHIREHATQGKVAIVTDKPTELLAATRKQWLKLIRQIQRERASTLDRAKITELSRQLVWMQNLTFTAKPPEDILEADVTFAVADDFVHIPPICPTVLVTYTFEHEKLHMLTSWMPCNAVVVMYESN
jgi:hypothetical protein